MRATGVLLTLLLLWGGNVKGQEGPSMGLVYNPKEASSLTYSCSRKAAHRIECEFTQTFVRQKAKPADLDATLKKAREEFRKGINLGADDCRFAQQLIDIVEGRAKPPEPLPRSLTALEKRDLTAMAKAMLTLCKSKTEQNYLAFMRVNHDRETRTCNVGSNSFKQRFQPIADFNATKPTWVVAQEGPEGPCGLVNLSRFELDKSGSVSFWTYTARKAVTNPGGTLLLGASCKALDEGEYLYDWRSQEHPLSCDYINFSPL